MMFNTRRLFLCTILILGAYAGILGIDFGAEWIKVAQIRGRVPDIILNEQSNRKTTAAFTFKDGIILYGSDAKGLETRQPEITYKHLWPLLGAAHGDPAVEAKNSFYAYPLEELEQGLAINVEGLNGTFPLESLVGVLFGYIKELSSKHIGRDTRDCVITVPPFWSHRQRQAVFDAAKVGGLNVISLLNQPTALGVHFVLTRKDLEAENNVIFYDMGASTTTVSLLTVQINTTATTPTSTVKMVDFEYEENLGGRDFDLRIAKYIVDDVMQKKGLDVSESGNRRAFAKVLKEAAKTKEVFSANTETGISFDGLVGDYDYRGHINRNKFEELSEDLFERAAAPLRRLFEENEQVSKENVKYVEIFGGGIRVPGVQQKLNQFLGREVDKHLNGDEAAVFGAAFYAALQSPLYRVTGIKVKDIFPYQINGEVRSTSGSLDKKTELVPVGVRYGFRKTLSLNTEEDFSVDATYGPSGKFAKDYRVTALNGQIGSWNVIVDSAISRYNYSKTEGPTIQLNFKLSQSGILELEKAEAELTVFTLSTPKKKNVTKIIPTAETTEEAAPTEEGSTTTSDPVVDGESPAETPIEENSEKVPEETAEATTEKSEEEEDLKPVYNKRIQRVTLTVIPKNVAGLSYTNFRQVEKGLQSIKLLIEEKREKEREKSTLESYIYDMKDKIAENAQYIKYSNEEQREAFSTALVAAAEWLDDEGYDAEASGYRGKLSGLKAFGDAIKNRIDEADKRPATVKKVYKSINTTVNQLFNITEKREVKQEEVDSFLDKCEEIKKFIVESSLEQEKKELWEEPVFTSEELWSKWTLAEFKAKMLLRRALKKTTTTKRKGVTINSDSDLPPDFINFGEGGMPENFKFENVKFDRGDGKAPEDFNFDDLKNNGKPQQETAETPASDTTAETPAADTTPETDDQTLSREEPAASEAPLHMEDVPVVEEEHSHGKTTKDEL